MAQAARSEPMLEWWQGVVAVALPVIGFISGRHRREQRQDQRREEELFQIRKELRQDLDAESAHRKTLESEYFNLRKSFLDLTQELGLVRNENAALGARVTTLTADKVALEARVQHLEEQLKNRDRELAAVLGERDALGRENASITSQLADANARILELEVLVAKGRPERGQVTV